MKRFAKESFLYAIGTFIQKATVLILVPFYTAVLTKQEYGSFETINVIYQALVVVLNFGLSVGLIRFYKECKDDNEVSKMLKTSIFLVIVFSIIFSIILLLFSNVIFGFLSFFSNPMIITFTTFIWSINGALNTQLFAIIRAKQEPKKYILLSTGICVSMILLNIYLVRILHFGVLGIIVGNTIILVVSNLLISKQFWVKDCRISFYWIKKLLTFSSPLLFQSLGLLILNTSDRYFLASLKGVDQVAIYGLGYKVAMILQAGIISPFQLAWGPYAINNYNPNQNKEHSVFSKIFSLSLAVFILSSFLIFIFSPEILQLLGNNKYSESISVIPALIASYIFYGIFYWASSLFHIKNKTVELSLIASISAIINLGLNYFLIRYYGIMGAAFATLISITFLAFFTLFVGLRHIPIKLEIGKITKLILTLILVVVIFEIIDFSVFSTLSIVFIKICLGLFFILILWLINFFDHEQKGKTLIFVRNIFQKFPKNDTNE